MPLDRFSRQIDYLRLSVIDHCNLRCVYCMPLRGLTFVPAPELLTAAEIETVARAAVGVGFRKFRLTGGEPTLRADIVEIASRIAARPRRRGPRHDHERDPAAPPGEAAARGGPAAPQHPRGHPPPRAAQEAHAVRLGRGGRGRDRRRRGGGPRPDQAQLHGHPRLQRRRRRGPRPTGPGRRLARPLHRAHAPRRRGDRPRGALAVRAVGRDPPADRGRAGPARARPERPPFRRGPQLPVRGRPGRSSASSRR